MCNIYLQKLEPETKKINFTTSVLYQLNNDSPHPPPPPKELVASRSPGQYKLRKKKIIIIITVKSMLTGHSQNPLYSQDN